MNEHFQKEISCPEASDCPGVEHVTQAGETAPCERVRQSMGLTELRHNYNQLLQEFADWSAGSNRQQGRLSSQNISSSDSGPDIAPNEHLDSQQRQHRCQSSKTGSNISTQGSENSSKYGSKHSSRHSSKQSSSKSTPGPSPRQLLKVQSCCETPGAVECLYKQNASSTQLCKTLQAGQSPELANAASAQQKRALGLCTDSTAQHSNTRHIGPIQLQQLQHQHTLSAYTDQQPKAAVVAAACQQHVNAETCAQLQQQVNKASSLAHVGAFENVLGAVKSFLGQKKPGNKQQPQSSAATHATGTATIPQGCQLSLPDVARSKLQACANIEEQCSSAQSAGSDFQSDVPAAETSCCSLHESSMLQLPLPPQQQQQQQQVQQPTMRQSSSMQHEQQKGGMAAATFNQNQQQQQRQKHASTGASKHSNMPRRSNMYLAASAKSPNINTYTENTTNISLPAASAGSASCKTVVLQPDTSSHSSTASAQSTIPLHPKRKMLRQQVKAAGSTSVGSACATANTARHLAQPQQQVAAGGHSALHARQQGSRVPLLPLHQLQESTPAAVQPAGHASTARSADGNASKSAPSSANLHRITAKTTRRRSCPDGDQPFGGTEAGGPDSSGMCQTQFSTNNCRPSKLCVIETQQQLQQAPIDAVDSGGPGSSSSSALTAADTGNRSTLVLAGNTTADVQQHAPGTLSGTPASAPCDALQHIKQLQMMRRRSIGPAVEGTALPDVTGPSSSSMCSAAVTVVGISTLLPAISGAFSAASTGAGTARTAHHRRVSSSGSGTSGHSSVVSTPRSSTSMHMPGVPTSGSRRTSSTQLQPLQKVDAVPIDACTAVVMLPPVAAASAVSSRRGSKTDDCSTGSGGGGQSLTRNPNISQRQALADVDASVSKEYSLSSIPSSSSGISCGDGGATDTGQGLTYEPSNFGVCSNNPAGAVQLHRPALIGKLERLKNRFSSRHLVIEGDAQPQQQQQQPTLLVVRTPSDAAVPWSKVADSLQAASEVVVGTSNAAAQADSSAAAVMATPLTGLKPAVHHGRSSSGTVVMSQHAIATCSNDGALHRDSSIDGNMQLAVGSRMLNGWDSKQQHMLQCSSQANQTAVPPERIRARWQVPQQQQQQPNRLGHLQDMQCVSQDVLQHSGFTRAWSCRQPTAHWELTEQHLQQPVQHHGKLGMSHSFNTASLQQRQQLEHAPLARLAGQVQQLSLQPSMPEQQWQAGQLQWDTYPPVTSQQMQNWQQQQQLHWQQQQQRQVLHQQPQHWQQQLQPPADWPPSQPQSQLQLQLQPNTLPPLAYMHEVCRTQQHLPPLPEVDGRRQVVEPLSAVHTIQPGTTAIAVSTAEDRSGPTYDPVTSGPAAATVVAVTALSATAVAVAGTAGGFVAPVPAHGALSRFQDPWAERQQQQSQQQQLQQHQALQPEAVASTQQIIKTQEPAANQQLLPPVTACSASAMARQRQEMQQQAFEGLSLEAVLKTAKKVKPSASRRHISTMDADTVPATADNATPSL